MKLKNFSKVLTILFLMIIISSQKVYADIGPKPSITIYVKNYSEKSYYLDLLSKEDSNLKYSDFRNPNKYPEELKNAPFYKYNEGGWIATHIRSQVLLGNIKGTYDEKTGLMIHKFYYRQVPKTFKVIVQKENGELIVSNAITPMQFNANVLLDLETGKLSKIPHISYGLSYFLFLIILTIIIELLIAKLLKLRMYKLIIGANLFTQLILHIVLVSLFYIVSYKVWYSYFLMLELLIVCVEFLIYKLFSKDYTWQKLLLFSCIANITTFLIGLLL